MKSEPNKIQDFGIDLARKNNNRHDGREKWIYLLKGDSAGIT